MPNIKFNKLKGDNTYFYTGSIPYNLKYIMIGDNDG